MAFFLAGETPTDDPFKEHLTPMEVAGSIQSALSALWLASPEGERSPAGLEGAARRCFDAVEQWWLKLGDRTGFAIVAATQQAFGMSAAAQEQARNGTLTMQTMASWIPSHSFAEALFHAWLLQPERERTPSGTADLVRRILERQLRAAGEDVAAFNPAGS
jgi:hypothetical protein